MILKSVKTVEKAIEVPRSEMITITEPLRMEVEEEVELLTAKPIPNRTPPTIREARVKEVRPFNI